MKLEDINKVIELISLGGIQVTPKDFEEQFDLQKFVENNFQLPSEIENVPPLISVDGSYCFLFSFIGADTWIVLFRIGVTEYAIKLESNTEIHYVMNGPPKVYDHLNVISFNEDILAAQPKFYSKVIEVAKGMPERVPGIIASNLLSYFEDLTLLKISGSRKDCILLKDGSLLTFKGLEREEIYKELLSNCAKNSISLAGVSKSTLFHVFNKFYTDDYFLERYYGKKYPHLTYITVPGDIFKTQTRFDVWGEVHFAKLHEHASKWFKIDTSSHIVDKDQFFSLLAAYSMVQLLPGYPIGLLEAHKVAKSVRDFKDAYTSELLEHLVKTVTNAEDFLNGMVDPNGRELGSFHEIIDKLSR